MDKADLFRRLSSRKFLATAVATTVAVLANFGVISPDTQATVIANLTPIIYILVQGFLDYTNKPVV